MEARISSDRLLREQERVSASILAAVPQAIIATDRQGVITLFSPGAENMLGYSAGEMIGEDETPLAFHDLEEVPTPPRPGSCPKNWVSRWRRDSRRSLPRRKPPACPTSTNGPMCARMARA